MPYAFFERVLEALEDAFRQIEAKVPPPVRKPWGESFVFRYEERTIQQAIVQKLARTLSGLHAIEALLERGLFQEQGIVQRAVSSIFRSGARRSSVRKADSNAGGRDS
jgi:hypothetical protein